MKGAAWGGGRHIERAIIIRKPPSGAVALDIMTDAFFEIGTGHTFAAWRDVVAFLCFVVRVHTRPPDDPLLVHALVGAARLRSVRV